MISFVNADAFTKIKLIRSLSWTESTREMTITTHSEFNEETEAIDVAKAFNAQIRGRTILITGVNQAGIGFSTAEAFVSGIVI